MKRGKKYIEFLKTFQRIKKYSIEEAIEILKKFPSKNETVRISIKTGIDPKRTDQAVRGSTVLPYGIGKDVKVMVITKGEKLKEARESGADIVGDEETIKEIAEKKEPPPVDVIIATPDVMPEIGKIGKILGPRGLMPNQKTGTVTWDIKEAVKNAKMGRVEFRTDKGGCINAPVGKISFEKEKLLENIRTFIKSVSQARPQSAKGVFLQTITLSLTHSPGVKIDVNSIFQKKK